MFAVDFVCGRVFATAGVGALHVQWVHGMVHEFDVLVAEADNLFRKWAENLIFSDQTKTPSV